MGEELNAGHSRIASPRAASVLVGRERERVFLREELAAAAAGHGRLVLLGGEAGIGKTTLARDLAQEAAARRQRVLTGSCFDLTITPPYGPWLDLVASYPADGALPAPPAAFAGGLLGRVTDQAALFADVRRFFAKIAEDSPSVIILEDLHWADSASLELLRHIAHHLNRLPILLLATYRVDELTKRHPLFRQIPALVREAAGLRLDLRRLDNAALRALVAARYELPAPDEARLVDYLERHAEGNPFFASELLRALEEDALLRAADGRWALGALDRVVVPSFLRQVIEGRVERLSQEIHQPLAIAAVIGQEVPLALWARVAGLDDEALLAIVEQAVEAHLLAAERDGTRVRFVHALTREALYEGIMPPRCRLWRQQVAEALMAGARPDPDAVAYHLQQAGDPRAWEWLVQAADRAQRAYAWLAAAERLQEATHLLLGVEGAEQTRGRLLYRVARLQRFSNSAGAIRFVDECGRLAAHVNDAILAAEVLFHRGVLLCYAGHFRAGLAEMVRGIERLEAMPLEATLASSLAETWLADSLPATMPGDPAADDAAAAALHAAGMHYRRGAYPFLPAAAGRLTEAIADGERFLAALAVTPGSSKGIGATAAFCHLGLGTSYAALGRPADARDAFARARALFHEIDHHTLDLFVLLIALRDVALTYDAADPAARRRLATEAEEALGRAGGALRPGLSPRLAWLSCLVLDGLWNDALQIVRDLPAPGNTYLRREVTGATAVLARHRGEPEIAWEQIRALLPDGPATTPGDGIHQEGLFLQRLASDLSLDAGDMAQARVWLEAHDAWLAWSGSVLGQADGRLAWARYLRAIADNDRARADAQEALTLASAPDQPLVRLGAHRLLGEIETAEQNLALAEAHLGAALDLAAVCEAPFERALTLLALAELRVALGASGEATEAVDSARQTCLPLGAAPALDRIAKLAASISGKLPGMSYPAGLTQREVEVLRLLALRHTDKEIAEALYLGPRTVQSHVAHILNKLGAANRREAAREAGRLGVL